MFVDPTLTSFITCGPLQFLVSFFCAYEWVPQISVLILSNLNAVATVFIVKVYYVYQYIYWVIEHQMEPNGRTAWTWGAELVQCWEHSPPTSVAWVRFPDLASHVVVGSRPCAEGSSPGSPVFLPSQKTNSPNSKSICAFDHHVMIKYALQISSIYIFIYLIYFIYDSTQRPSQGNDVR